MLSRPEVAAVELRQVLSPALIAKLDWETLTLTPGSYISPKLRARHTDILYSIGFQGSSKTAFIYVLIEHQSQPDRLMAFRFNVYLSRIWEQHVANHEGAKTLPLVIPVLMYQGPERWTQPRRLSELFDVPPELGEAFGFPAELVFEVDDLRESVLRDQQTRDALAGRAVVLAEATRTLLWLAYQPHENLGERVEQLGHLLTIVLQTWGVDDLQAFFTYILSVFEHDSPLVAILFESVSKEAQQVYNSIREHLLAQGEAKGIAKGVAKGRAEGAVVAMIRMFEHLLDRRGLKLTDALRQRVHTCTDESVLQRWFDRALTATTLADIFDD